MAKTKANKPSILFRLAQITLGFFLLSLAMVSAYYLVGIAWVRSEFSSAPEDELSDSFSYVNTLNQTPSIDLAFTILQEQVVSNPEAIIFLYSWEIQRGKHCLAASLVMSYLLGWDSKGTAWDCSSARYTANKGLLPNYHAIYGFSADASHVEVILRGEPSRRIRPIGSTYMLVTNHTARVERVRLLDAAGAELASLDDFD